MNALSEIGDILTAMKIPWQTGAYTEPAPDQYVVLVPLGDTFDIMADNRPQFDVQAVRLSIFSKRNYNMIKNQLVRILLDADFFCPTEGIWTTTVRLDTTSMYWMSKNIMKWSDLLWQRSV